MTQFMETDVFRVRLQIEANRIAQECFNSWTDSDAFQETVMETGETMYFEHGNPSEAFTDLEEEEEVKVEEALMEEVYKHLILKFTKELLNLPKTRKERYDEGRTGSLGEGGQRVPR